MEVRCQMPNSIKSMERRKTVEAFSASNDNERIVANDNFRLPSVQVTFSPKTEAK
jgi:hypothetical protein